MNFGVIDVGANSVRMNVYQYENKGFDILFSKKKTLGIVSYINDGKMSEKGIQILCRCLHDFQLTLSHLHIASLHVFATVPLRNIKNTTVVLQKIFERTGIRVHVLSGEDEGRLSFEGASIYSKLQKGLFLDVGGGSTEIVSFQDCQMHNVYSISSGSLSLFRTYVSEILPNEKQQKEIIEAMLRELKEKDPNKEYASEIMLAAGGSARACAALLKDLHMIESTKEEIPCEKLQELITYLNREDAIRIILRCEPERIHTFFPGLLILYSTANYYGCKKMQISKYGVREGYVLKKILPNARF